MTRVTVILPTYEGATYLAPQIESILAQTASDLELLVVDDGSRDDSVGIVDDFACRDPRVRRLASSGNKGQRLRLRELAEQVTTEFLAIADQDDLWQADRNARLLDAIGDRAMAFGRSQLIDAEGRDSGRSILEALGIDVGRAGRLGSLFNPLVSGHAAIIRRSWLDTAAFVGTCPFDYMLGLTALWSDGLVYVDEAVVLHRIHGGNQSNGGVHEATGDGHSIFLDRLSLFLALNALSRSASIDVGIRKTLDLAAAKCRWTWFEQLDISFPRARMLKDDLRAMLGPHASNAADLAVFEAALERLTRLRSLSAASSGLRRLLRRGR